MGGIAEVVEFDKARDLAWINITGVTQRGRFRVRDAGPGRTIVTFRLAYHSDGGLLGLIADRIAARQVGRSLSESLKNLQRLVGVIDRTRRTGRVRPPPHGTPEGL